MKINKNKFEALLFLTAAIIGILYIIFHIHSNNINIKDLPNDNSNNLKELNIVNETEKFTGSKTIFLFYADWCRYSKMFLPIWDNIVSSNTNNNITFRKINVDENQDLAIEYTISKLPTVIDNNKNIFEISFDYPNTELEQTFIHFINN
jgi:thiol-disulfide isomerase/thioredoxin